MSSPFVLRTLLGIAGVCALLVSFGIVVRADESTEEAKPAAGRDLAAALEARLEASGSRRAEFERALGEIAAEERAGLEFIIAYLPDADLRSIDTALLVENVREAYAARRRAPWGASLPEDVFLNDVLPHAFTSETREPWRRAMAERCWPLVEGCKTAAEAAQRLNERLFPAVGVKYSTARRRADQSPGETMESGVASCTGLSILLAAACRSVAVPARLAGVASWTRKRGNHTWVEVYDGDWHFTGAAEPDARGLDHAWFAGDAAAAQADSRRHAVWATSYRPTGETFPLVWAPGLRLGAVNVTERYTRGTEPPEGWRVLVSVLDARGKRLVSHVDLLEEFLVVTHGDSRGESADLNDVLELTVPNPGEYWLVAHHGGAEVRERVIVDERLERVVLRWPEGER